MICETCRNSGRPGYVCRPDAIHSTAGDPGWIPCPDCGGSTIAHCCDGLTACNDPSSEFYVIGIDLGREPSKGYCGHPDCTGDNHCEQTKICMCGSYVEGHGIGDGHSPVSMHDYLSRDDEAPRSGL